MSFTSSAGITGPQAHPEGLDAAVNSRPNVNRTARKAAGTTFSDLLNETIKKASHPTPAVGGAGPLQSNGLGIVGMSPNMSRGNIINTGNPLDLAVEGEGYFVLTDGRRDVYTRAGSFAVDANMNLVDPAIGFHVKRIGSEGEIEGFQMPAHSEIRVPYDTTMPAKAT
ncbi:MAG: flagellar hook-basal body complex protein, partial [Planctomycetota bacterium]